MSAPTILVRTLSASRVADKQGQEWQYHSRSDHHSKVTCWAILFDLIRSCSGLRDDVTQGRVVFGINHKMVDFEMNRKKSLDLVVGTPVQGSAFASTTFASLAKKYGVVLSEHQRETLGGLPKLHQGNVGAVRLALEAKACMTEHGKAGPRLHDELESSHLTIHGADDEAIAIGLVMVNTGPEFISPGKNTRPGIPRDVNRHDQPRVTEMTLEKLKGLSRRSKRGERGFDALGIVLVSCRNDGSPVELIESLGHTRVEEAFEYERMIPRVCQQYETRFAPRG